MTVVIVTAGSVSSWTVADAHGAAQPIVAPPTAGQCIPLEPGDTVEMIYAAAPTWRWNGG